MDKKYFSTFNPLKLYQLKKMYGYKRLKEKDPNLKVFPKLNETYKKYPQPEPSGKGYRINKKKRRIRKKARKKQKCRH